MTLIPEFVRSLESWRPTAFGIIILGLLLIRPDGLLAFRHVTTRAKGVLATSLSDGAKPD
jgi:branched-chain amino acid transport system permease protein